MSGRGRQGLLSMPLRLIQELFGWRDIMGPMAVGIRAIGDKRINSHRHDHIRMAICKQMAILMFFLVLIPSVWAKESVLDPRMSRPPAMLIKSIVGKLPVEYQAEVFRALRKSGRNAWALMDVLKSVDTPEQEGAAFLIANMPGRDLVALKADLLIANIHWAYQALQELPWGKSIPHDIFLNDVLPYASINERRDDWRRDFYQRFISIAKASGSIDQAVYALNKDVFNTFKVSYNPILRPKPDQSPYETIQAHYASCTGLSVLLIDALRSVGIPARIAAIAMWPDASGNHTWVEIWDGQWHYIGAAEPTSLDHTWFTSKAAQTDARHPIFAVSFKKTRQIFPMRWAPYLRFVSAVDVTKDYANSRR